MSSCSCKYQPGWVSPFRGFRPCWSLYKKTLMRLRTPESLRAISPVWFRNAVHEMTQIKPFSLGHYGEECLSVPPFTWGESYPQQSVMIHARPHQARVIDTGHESSTGGEFSRPCVSAGPLLRVLMLFYSTLGMLWSLLAVMWKCCHLLLMSTVCMRNYWFSNWALITDTFVSAAWKLWCRLGGKMSRRLVTGENTCRQQHTLPFLV